jgi:hypothetical protein
LSLPLKLSALLLLAPGVAGASDAMIYAAAYGCQADAINQDLVDSCTSKFPELTPSAQEAIANWRSRNAVKAKQAHETCEVQITELAGNAAGDELAQFRQQMQGLRFDIKMDFQMRAEQEGESACVAALGQLNSGGGAMDFQ